MDVSVLIPWRPTDQHREAALAWVTDRWRRHGYEPVLGVLPDGGWCKALAITEALRDAHSAVLVVADADVWTDGVHEAIQRVRDGAPWVIPHLRVHRLNREATTQVLAGTEPHAGMPLEPFHEGVPGFAYTGVVGGGVVVCRRDVYEDCPLDPRFVGWGQEDESWALALRCLYGPPARLPHPLWHLWHPPQPRMDRGAGSDEGMALYKRYARAKRRPHQMRALIEEGRRSAHPV